ncbi:MAG: ribosomal RNA small subunit methyltransferase A [Candidatus Cloacimonetes bacterium]|nr:ribosomal RNA small subunit methyltransferase A [Candidatus Cloacimonadota bacterium]
MKKRHSLGQNFLTDPDIAAQIAASAGIEEGETVWEIGPGMGILTQELLKYQPRLTAFEIDGRLIPFLEKRFRDSLEHIHGDILQQDWAALIAGKELKLVSNLPYQISSPLLELLQRHHQSFKLSVLMLQREVAHRLTASPGSKAYGALSLRMQLNFDIEVVMDVSKDYFDPVPQVDSSVVRITPRAIPAQIQNLTTFHRLIRIGFSSRRKTMRNNLLPHYDKATLLKLQDSSGIDLQRRAETLSEAEFILLSDLL